MTNEALMIEIGKSLLACQIVERQIGRLLKYVYPDRHLTAAEFLRSLDKKDTLGTLIRKAAKRFKYDAPTQAFLKKFTDHRNQFVHNLLDVRGFSLSSDEGRKAGAKFVMQVYSEATSIRKALDPLIIKWINETLSPREREVFGVKSS